MNDLLDHFLRNARHAGALDDLIDVPQPVDRSLKCRERVVSAKEHFVDYPVLIGAHHRKIELKRPGVERGHVGVEIRMLADCSHELIAPRMPEMSDPHAEIRKPPGDFIEQNWPCQI